MPHAPMPPARLRPETLEPRDVPAPLPQPDLPTAPDFTAVGTASRPVYLSVAEATGGLIRVFDFSTGTERLQIRPFGGSYAGGVRVATGDVNDDDVPDVVCATGPGRATVVKVFDGATGAKIAKFTPFGTAYAGGADVAVGDFNADGRGDVVVGGGAHNRVKVFNGATISAATPTKLGKFTPFGTGFTTGYTGGVRVAVGDVNNDDVPDVVAITASGRPVVAGFSGKTINSAVPFQPFYPYYAGGPNRTGGLVGVLDVNNDGYADIVTGAENGPAQGRITDGKTLPAGGDTTTLRVVGLTPATLANGAAVALADLDADGTAELVLASNAGARPVVSIHEAATGKVLTSFYAFDPNFLGGVEVG